MVYVDNMNAGFGRMKMCHMIADSTDELLSMADKIGVQRKWIQDAGQYSEHFDVCLSAKKKAIAAGAVEITMMQLGRKTALRPGSPFLQIDKNKQQSINKDMSLFDKKENETAPESNPAALVKQPEEKPDETAKEISEKLNSSVTLSAELLPQMVDKAIKCELALSKIVAINNDADDAVAEKLLVKNRNTYNEINAMRTQITAPLDEIKELAMRPEKRISIMANQPDSTFNRVKKLRDTYANAKLKKQQAEKAEADRKKNAGEEIIRLKAVFETRFYDNIVDLLTKMENNIVSFFASLTVENFDEKIKKFDVKPQIKTDVYESWFSVDYNKTFLNDAEFDAFIKEVREAYTYEGINKIYVEKAEEKIKEWKLKLPAKKTELIELADLAKSDAAAAEQKQKEIAAKEQTDQAQREKEANEQKQEKASEVQTAVRSAQLDNEFDHLKVVQNQEQIKGAVKKYVATLDCEPKNVVEVISKMIYTLFTVPVPNATFHYKKDRSGVILPADENGRPVYDDWLETLLTKFAATGVKLDGVRIDERLGTVQKAK